MKTLLIYPPTSDPTQPYLSLAYLSAFLKERGEEVLIKDANIEAYHFILEPGFLKRLYQKFLDKLNFYERGQGRKKPHTLSFEEQKDYFGLYLIYPEIEDILEHIQEAKEVLKNPETFFDPEKYDWAVCIINKALKFLSAVYYPLELTFTQYNVPLYMTSYAELQREIRRKKDPQDPPDPFMVYYQDRLMPFIANEEPDVVGISIVFPAQLLQTLVLCDLIKRTFPHIHVTVGGPAITQMAIRIEKPTLTRLFAHLDSIVIYEGEHALYNLLSCLREDRPLQNLPHVITYDRRKDRLFLDRNPYLEDINALPCPSYEGFPLDLYLTPQLVLLYAPTRGCYWEKCAFCHYGLTDKATAPYRERKAELIVEDLQTLSEKHQTCYFYFSDDLISPRLILKLSELLIRKGLNIKWSSDMRLEKTFTLERCQALKKGGCVSVALGLESGNQRILDLMDKGIRVEEAEKVVQNLSAAGIAPQIMTFLDFPTETRSEAEDTLDFIARNLDYISLFVVGTYDLEAGSRTALEPARYHIQEIYYLLGDEFKTHCCYQMDKPYKTEEDRLRLDERIDELSRYFKLRTYPWAGTVSVAHSQLYFDRYGKDIFKILRQSLTTYGNKPQTPSIWSREFQTWTPRIKPGIQIKRLNFNLNEINDYLSQSEAKLREILVEKNRSVERALYEKVVQDLPRVYPLPSWYLFRKGQAALYISEEVRELLYLCGGTKTIHQIVTRIGKKYRRRTLSYLKELYAQGILEG